MFPRPMLALATTSLVWLLTTPVAAYDTINCARDTSPAERTICASQNLQVLDAKVTEKYTDIMLDGHIASRIKAALHDSQLTFLKRREMCGANAQCIAEVMERRASRIDLYR